MPSITFVNMDGESKTMDLTTMTNKEALFDGFDHLDKPFKDPQPYTQKLKDELANS